MSLLEQSRAVLKSTFGYQGFHTLQEKVLASIYANQDTLVILPTGGGKSLCYQIPALILSGVTFVISPLISLMKDQVDQLQELGVSATFLNSSLSASEIRQCLIDIHSMKYKLAYIAPERLDSDLFKRMFSALVRMKKVDLIAIDEAHCISQWGHDFRPAYKKISKLRELAPDIPFLALTATATKRVKQDIMEQLKLKNTQAFVGGFDRPNLHYSVYEPNNKLDSIFSILKNKKEQSGIIYCGTRKHVEQVSEFLNDRKIKVGKYHAGLKDDYRRKIQEQFIKDEVLVVVATNAFGMGIDKSNVRFIIHYDMPGTLEHYTQEAGRAGRDGEPSECTLLFSGSDIMLQRFFIDGNNPPPKLFREIMEKLKTCNKSSKELSSQRLMTTSNSMAIETALKMLEAWGAIENLQDYEHISYRLTGKKVTVSMDELKQKRQQSEEKLQQMIAYVETTECKRNTIQAYFDFEPVNCSSCSSCEERSHSAKAQQEDVTDMAQLILRGVASFPRSFGMGISAAILCGSDSQKVRQWKAQKWSAYGSLREYSQSSIIKLMKQLIRKSLLQRDGGEFPVISISSSGQKSLDDGESIMVKKQETLVSKLDVQVREDIDQILFDLLRQFRTQEAKSRNVPPYIIFGDRTLREMASYFPQTSDQLQMISGMGDKKLEQYGKQLLNIIIPYCREHNLSYCLQDREISRTGLTIRRASVSKKYSGGDSKMETMKLLKQDKSPVEVAQLRDLNISTIEGHMAELVSDGQIEDISLYINIDYQKRILTAIDQIGYERLKPIKQLVGDDISYGKIRMVVATFT